MWRVRGVVWVGAIALVVLCCCLAPILLQAQNTRTLDSLHRRLATPNLSLPERIKAYTALSVEHRNDKLDSAVAYGLRARQLAHSKGIQLPLLAEAYKNLGLAHWFQAHYGTALLQYDSAYTLYRLLGDKKNQASVVRYRGMVEIDQGSFLLALQHFRHAAALADSAGSRYEWAGAINQRGVVLHKQRAYRAALQQFDQALHVYDSLNSRSNIALTYSNMGLVLADMGRYKEALFYQLRSLQIKRDGYDTRAIAYSYRILGVLYQQMGQLASSDSNYQASLTLYRQLKVPYGQTKCLIGLAENRLRLQQAAAAYKLANQAMEQANAVNATEVLMEASGILAKASAASGNYQKAYTNHVLHKRMADSLANIETARKVYELDALAKEQRQLETLERQRVESELQGRINYALSGVLALAAVLGAVLAFNFWRSSRDNRMLRHKNQQIEDQQKLITAQRDDLQQALDRLNAAQAQMILNEKMAALGQLIANIAHEINTPISAVRTSARTTTRLLPQVLDELPHTLRSVPPIIGDLLLDLARTGATSDPRFTTRQERELRKRLAAELGQQLHLSADEAARRAATLAALHVEGNWGIYRPILEREDAEHLLLQALALAQAHQNLRLIERTADKTARIVSALKTYSHTPHLGEKRPVDLPDTLDQVMLLYENLLQQGVELELDIPRPFSHEYQLLGFADELEQVWSKLVHNALLAMADTEEKKLRIHARVMVLEQKPWAVIHFVDAGVGIPAEAQARIFEPFFTLRPKGQGSGLGLDISRKLVTRMGGSIQLLHSRPGQTVFEVRLPLVPVPVAQSVVNV